MVYSEFPSRIRIGYVLRGEGNYSYLCEQDLSSMPISLKELHAAALTNLAGLSPANISTAKAYGGVEGWIH
jgi:hypothetical protein